MVITPVGSRKKLELKLRQVRALPGPMIEGEFYNQSKTATRKTGTPPYLRAPLRW
jgi:hypothetical protein